MSESMLHALVVEDDAGPRALMQEILEGRGHEVDAHETAESAWHSFQRMRHPLVVLDWRLPGMDGPELCRRIREVPEAEDIYILFVTGKEGRSDLQAALDAGASDYIVKSTLHEQIEVRLAIAERHLREARRRREREAELTRDALHDPLTGLPNRGLFLERLDQAERRAVRQKDHPYAILLVDLHDFVEVNHRLGREAADRVLVETARRLEASVREVDTVARFQEDDFAILLDGFRDVSDPSRVAYRIHRSLAEPFQESDIELGASIGTAISLGDEEGPQDLLRDAGRALLRAMSLGPGSHQIYDPEMHDRAQVRIQLEARLRRAMEQDEMRLHYQPVVSLEDGRVEGFEALMRWQDPERGLVSPAEFIPVAEETGLVVPLGWWALDEGLTRLEGWREAFPREPALTVSVNTSVKQFATPDLVGRITGLLEKSGLPPESLYLEITETSLMADVEATIETLRSLHRTSVRLHVDDFGTGYSSLAYLCRFPIDSLKIDRSFISTMTHSTDEMEVVRTIVQLARNLGMSVVAEGVETEEQAEILRSLGCDRAQGYLYARPLPPEDVPSFLADRNG